MILAPPGANSARAGFTLLELLAVLVLVAILGGLVLGAGRRAVESGRVARARSELAVLAAALENYRATYGDYPSTDDPARLLQSLLGRRGPANTVIAGRTLLVATDFTTADARDPFADSTAQLVDPWGQPYRYAYKMPLPWGNPGYVLYSAGPDGSADTRLLAGGFPNTAAAANADNIHANR